MRKVKMLIPLLALPLLLTACEGDGEKTAVANAQVNDCCSVTEAAADNMPDCCKATEPETNTTVPPAPGGCCGRTEYPAHELSADHADGASFLG